MAGPTSSSLAGRVALVTGASRGIGRGIAERLARDGATVVLAARDVDRLRDVAAGIRAHGATAWDIAADLADEAAVDRLFGAIDAGPGGPDILVNNASLVYGTERPFLELDVGLWDEVVRANLRTLFLCTNRAAIRMADRGGGGIVNISAASAQRAHRLTVPYDATKGAVDAFTRATALDLAPHGIRVNAVAPGPIVVEAWGELSAEEMAKRAETVPIGRLGGPDDVAGLVSWLCSDDASYLTGQVIAVDGGLLAQLRSPQAEILPEVQWSR